jgi:hypothetical protein
MDNNSPQNENRALLLLVEGQFDNTRFPFLTFVSSEESFSVSDGLSTTVIRCVCYQGETAGVPPTARETRTLGNFLRFFRGVNALQKHQILHIHETDVITIVTFHEIDSPYAVSVIYHESSFAILVKLRSFNLCTIANVLRQRFGLGIRMIGSYFMEDETNMPDSCKRNRLSSLSI